MNPPKPSPKYVSARHLVEGADALATRLGDRRPGSVEHKMALRRLLDAHETALSYATNPRHLEYHQEGIRETKAELSRLK